jgi:hypothetical protein
MQGRSPLPAHFHWRRIILDEGMHTHHRSLTFFFVWLTLGMVVIAHELFGQFAANKISVIDQIACIPSDFRWYHHLPCLLAHLT